MLFVQSSKLLLIKLPTTLLYNYNSFYYEINRKLLCSVVFLDLNAITFIASARRNFIMKIIKQQITDKLYCSIIFYSILMELKLARSLIGVIELLKSCS